MIAKQRDNFSHWLRAQRVVRYDSHQIARDPSARWLLIYGSDGWIRASPVGKRRRVSGTVSAYTTKLAGAGIWITQVVIISFKRLPEGQNE